MKEWGFVKRGKIVKVRNKKAIMSEHPLRTTNVHHLIGAREGSAKIIETDPRDENPRAQHEQSVAQ